MTPTSLFYSCSGNVILFKKKIAVILDHFNLIIIIIIIIYLTASSLAQKIIKTIQH